MCQYRSNNEAALCLVLRDNNYNSLAINVVRRERAGYQKPTASPLNVSARSRWL